MKTEAIIILEDLIKSAEEMIKTCKDNDFDWGVQTAYEGRIITYKELLLKLYEKL